MDSKIYYIINTLKRIAFFIVAVVALAIPEGILAKKVQLPKMYVFGMAASFNDTIVYFTNVQQIDSVWVESKNHFMLNRDIYSQQLRNHLKNNEGMYHRTCIVVADKDRKKLEKKYLKFRKLYSTSKDGMQHYDIRYLGDSDFRFYTVNMHDYYDNTEGEQ